MNLCYTLEPNQETERQKRHREYAAKIALQNRAIQEMMGLCRCWSLEREEFERNLYARGCPKHPRRVKYRG